MLEFARDDEQAYQNEVADREPERRARDVDAPTEGTDGVAHGSGEGRERHVRLVFALSA